MLDPRLCALGLLLVACAAPAGLPSDVPVPATPAPDRIVLTWVGAADTTQSVTWRTDGSGERAVGEVALATGGPAFAREGLNCNSSAGFSRPGG